MRHEVGGCVDRGEAVVRRPHHMAGPSQPNRERLGCIRQIIDDENFLALVGKRSPLWGRNSRLRREVDMRARQAKWDRQCESPSECVPM